MLNRLIIFLLLGCYGVSLAAQPVSRSNGFKYKANGVTTDVAFISENIIKVSKYRGDSALLEKSLAVLSETDNKINTDNIVNAKKIVSSSDKITAIFDINGLNLSFKDQNGRLRVSEVPQSAIISGPGNKDGKFSVSQSYLITPEEAIYGLGQHQSGIMNQRNQTVNLRQSNMEIAVPFFQSTEGYAILWDNNSPTVYRDSNNVIQMQSVEGDYISYYIIIGESSDELIAGYRKLTGQVPMLPLWAFGYFQSRERYKSQKEVLNTVKKYRQLRVPLDCIVQDWQYWGIGDSNWNALEFNNPQFPDPGKLIDSVHALHSKIIISVWPSFGNKTTPFKKFNEKGYLYDFKTYPFNGAKIYDAFNPKARDMYWSFINRNLKSLGIDGWWLDATEPVIKEKFKTGYKDATKIPKNVQTYIGNFRKYANAYPLATVSGIYNHLRASDTKKRAFILTRSAFLGQQRNGAVIWSGDITASWKVLKAQIPAALNLSYSGIPYWNSDIGGFRPSAAYAGGVDDLTYHELYIRWLQFGVFTGMLRSHGTGIKKEIYQFGSPGSISFDVIKKYIELRYKLLPYIYSSARNITSHSGTLMKGLAMDFPKDKNVYNDGNSYLFGPSVLVSPVTDPIFSKNTPALNYDSTIEKEIYLPKGRDWYDFWTNRKIKGGERVVQEVNISQIPVFCKEGAIIPLAVDDQQYTSMENFKNLEIRIFAGADGHYVLYEDEGDGYNYEKGIFSEIGFKWNDSLQSLTIEKRAGKFPGMLLNRTFKVKVINKTGVTTKSVLYDGHAVKLDFQAKR